ncbi:30S ribosomal protein S6 [Patescibacteria group bacterium]|nr:30S ribosomal protein S6 [Patescibacteria group bacterium]MBU2158908.1 30S ribosomal protein S6 [Patescibacteria group bacterium]MBU2220571.1 30S ribosomal protein S6 [Patescibacteria group bacterium]
MAKNDIESGEMVIDTEHAETRVYELAFHIDPELPQEEAKKTYQALREGIAGTGSVVAEGEIQKVPLAYTISRKEHAGRRDFDSAFFGWVAYEADGAGHQKVLEMIQAESRVFRFLDLRTTVDAAKHAAEIHEFYAKLPEKPREGDDEASDAQLDAALKEAGV